MLQYRKLSVHLSVEKMSKSITPLSFSLYLSRCKTMTMQVHLLFEVEKTQQGYARAFFKQLVLSGGQRANFAFMASSMALFWRQMYKVPAYGISLPEHCQVIQLTTAATIQQSKASWEIICKAAPSIPADLYQCLATQPAMQCYVCKELRHKSLGAGPDAMQKLEDFAKEVERTKLFVEVSPSGTDRTCTSRLPDN